VTEPRTPLGPKNASFMVNIALTNVSTACWHLDAERVTKSRRRNERFADQPMATTNSNPLVLAASQHAARDELAIWREFGTGIRRIARDPGAGVGMMLLEHDPEKSGYRFSEKEHAQTKR
jgi:hypothetical protein